MVKSVLIVIIALVSMCVSTQSVAGPNANTTMVLHAVQTAYGPCEIDDPCDPGPPTIEIVTPLVSHRLWR